MICEGHSRLSISHQCSLLGISRSAWYKSQCPESSQALEIMRTMDELFLNKPYLGSRQMRKYLRRQGYEVGRHRVRRLMRLMGLTAIYQHPRTSVPHPQNSVYPTCCGILTLCGPIRCGLLILRISPCNVAFCTLLPLWTGIAARS